MFKKFLSVLSSVSLVLSMALFNTSSAADLNGKDDYLAALKETDKNSYCVEIHRNMVETFPSIITDDGVLVEYALNY